MHRVVIGFALLLLIPANPNFQSTMVAVPAHDLNLIALQGKEHTGHEQEEWTYKGAKGPEHWSEKFPDCAHTHQSPIDIETARTADLPAIEFHYQASPLFIMNNGHTIQISFPADKTPENTIKIGDQEYKLLQFHFHRPSEERMHGHSSDMVVHLVHGQGEGASQRLAVVAVLFHQTTGVPNQLLGTLWQHIPKEASHEPQEVPGVQIDPSGFLPSERAYYTYSGSLTTPPCSEIVTWYILKKPLPISSAQLGTFEKYYINNARPPQPVNGRTLLQSK
jgi:carbonic anhydrase